MSERTSHRPSRRRAAALALLLAPVLTLGLLGGSAHADVGDRDPERVAASPTPATQRSAGRASVAPTAAPDRIDSDVFVYTISATGRTVFPAAGHLRLTLKKGSTTRYTGTFVDHVGGKSAKASADVSKPEAPTLTLKARNGEFRFRAGASFGGASYSGVGTKAPAKLGVKAAEVYLAASAHSVRTATYALTLTQRSGPVHRPTEYRGTMTIAYDANSRVSGGQVTVTDAKGRNRTRAITNSGYFSTTYFYTVVKVDTLSMGISATFVSGGFTGVGFSGSGLKTTQWAVVGTP